MAGQSGTSDSPLLRLTNLGVRAPDLEAEVAFLEAFGASGVERVERMHEGKNVERIRVQLGPLRVVLFRHATYDDQLESMDEQRGGGIGHMAFEVESTEQLLRVVATRGILPLIPTFTVPASSSGPMRRITYFRSPNGTIVETQEKVTGSGQAS